VDYGLSALKDEVIRNMVSSGSYMDLAVVFEELSDEGSLAGYEVDDRFYEIGSPDGLRSLEGHLREG
jgi:NDP-sugar pyrophosphorylase family protein